MRRPVEILGDDFAAAGIPDLKLDDILGHASLGHDAVLLE